jgi:hypothetical protein
MDLERPRCTPGLRFYQWLMEKNRRARLWNQGRLRALIREHGGEIDVFCSHDLDDLERRTGRPVRVPAGAMETSRSRSRFGPTGRSPRAP